MPFGLRNARATYQRLVDKAFHKQIDRNLEVYVDDLVIKSRTDDEIIRDIEETFKTLREINMKLNPKMYFRGRRRDVSRLQGQYQRNKADFIVERPEKDDPDTAIDAEEELPEPWTLFTDGSSCADGSRAGLILTSPKGAEFTYALRFRFEATNNEAEYEALIAGLRIAEEMGVKNLQANLDSRLVANQVNGTYIAKEADMIRYLEKVRTFTNGFRMFSIKQVPRRENKKADALSKIASTSFAHLSKQVLVEELKEKSINELEVLAVVEEERNTWMTPIYEYLTEETLPAEVNKARAVWHRSQRFAMINGVLYKKSFLRPWLRCTRSVVAKALRTGYYWPTMHKDARALIRACQDCQVHKHVLRNQQQKSNPITSPWAFYKWGIDIVGPFPEGFGKVKFLIVAIDYFTMWIKAKPVATITSNQVKKIVWDNIVCRFRLPGEIISDNEKQFQDNPKIGVKRSYALSWKPCQGDSLNLPDHRAQVDQGSQIKMIQVKEMMQDNDLKNSKSKDKGSKSRSQSMDEQSHYKQDKTITRQSINVKRHIFDVIGGTEEFEERDLNIGGDC
ncbi:reverse transcriptase domain-containing protein [Tanacetum coccineum]